MASIVQSVRGNLHYASGYLQGRSYAYPRSFADLYAFSVARLTRLVTLPLPLLSFLALPFFGGTSTTINLFFFWLTWSALVMSHDPLQIELVGTLVMRVLCFLLPALGCLSFDLVVPKLSGGIKARGGRSLPQQLRQNKLLEVAGVAVGNVLLSVAVQGILEVLATRVLHLRSILKVTTTVPLPWNILKDLLRGIFLRGVLHYGAHRYLLHTYDTPLKTWHLCWQHSIKLPFSLVAAYDHPVSFLVGHWLPVFLPAYLFRYHVLTWHIFVAITSLEDLFVYSGYAVLPSSIVLAGMARRTDSHFESAHSRRQVGNFGHLGLMDLLCRTSLTTTDDVMDDLKNEAQKHQLEDRVQAAVAHAMAGLDDPQNAAKPRGKGKKDNPAGQIEAADEEVEAAGSVPPADEGGDRQSPRKRLFRRGRKG